jgi:hypothetical protein
MEGTLMSTWTVVEQVESLKFLWLHITKELTWSTHTNTFVKKARQHFFPLKSGTNRTLNSFYPQGIFVHFKITSN